MIRLVQIAKWHRQRRVALVDEPAFVLSRASNPSLSWPASCCSRYDASLSGRVIAILPPASSSHYDEVYDGRISDWNLLAPIDVPGDPERVLVSGTGLTHLGSAKDRQAMHAAAATPRTKPR